MDRDALNALAETYTAQVTAPDSPERRRVIREFELAMLHASGEVIGGNWAYRWSRVEDGLVRRPIKAGRKKRKDANARELVGNIRICKTPDLMREPLVETGMIWYS